MAINSKISVSKHINPLFPAYYALVVYNYYLRTNNDEYLKIFWKQVSFLEKYGQWEDDSFLLKYNFDYDFFQLKAPWIAGITQGLVASVFYRAYLANQDTTYKKLQKGSLQSFYLNIEKGGLLINLPNDFVWIEEYPSEKPSMVLISLCFLLLVYLNIISTLKIPISSLLINS